MTEKKSSCFVANIDLSLADKLKSDLISQGFELSTPTHTLFQGKKQGISLTLYSSGKLTVQGKNKDEFMTFYLEPEILGSLSYSYPTQNLAMHARIGVDEAGKGDFFGPLCIAGMYAQGEEDILKMLSMGVKDSKKLSDTKIIEIAKELKKHFTTSVIRIFPERYNEMYESFKNLNSLLAWGHATVIANLYEKTDCKEAIIDQFASEHVVESALKRKNIPINLTQRTKGEEDPVVAAASILARAAFVEGIEELEKETHLSLPKGVNSDVKKSARKAVGLFGKEILVKIAKLHFKTTQEILLEN